MLCDTAGDKASGVGVGWVGGVRDGGAGGGPSRCTLSVQRGNQQREARCPSLNSQSRWCSYVTKVILLGLLYKRNPSNFSYFLTGNQLLITNKVKVAHFIGMNSIKMQILPPLLLYMSRSSLAVTLLYDCHCAQLDATAT